MKLRSYQREILDQTKIALKQGAKAPFLVLPTGAGKTVIFSELAKDFVEKGKQVLLLVHRRELVKQACQKLMILMLNMESLQMVLRVIMKNIYR